MTPAVKSEEWKTFIIWSPQLKLQYHLKNQLLLLWCLTVGIFCGFGILMPHRLKPPPLSTKKPKHNCVHSLNPPFPNYSKLCMRFFFCFFFLQNPTIQFKLASFCSQVTGLQHFNRKSYLVEEYSCQWCTVSRFEESHNVSHAPFQRVTVQLQLFSNFNLYLLDKPPGTKRTKILQKAWTPLLASTPDVQLPNEALTRAPNCTYSVVKRCADSTVLQVEVTSSQPVSSDLKPGLGTAEVEPRMANSWEVESSPFCLQLSV